VLVSSSPHPRSAGWVDEVDGKSCVVCPYHGWAFDDEGYVRDVPASENKVRLRATVACIPVLPGMHLPQAHC
jgi:phenylpropionate dioxygenase-like ring-hydroxylating dioxygenase large terminal subunit